jgi:hypothetical protein
LVFALAPSKGFFFSRASIKYNKLIWQFDLFYALRPVNGIAAVPAVDIMDVRRDHAPVTLAFIDFFSTLLKDAFKA